MPWYLPGTDVIKKKVCRYLLQRYLGQFLEEKLSLEQLNVDLYNGTGTVSNIALYSKSLNELCESQKWPVEVVEGHLGSVTVNIPWNALMAEDSYIEVSHLYLALKPKPIENDGKSVLESMWSSMSSSMQLAQDCMESENAAQNIQAGAMEGLEKFAMTIDNVLNRIKAKLTDSEIRIEYVLPNNNCGVALIIKVENVEYQNEAGHEVKCGGDGNVIHDDEEEEEEEIAAAGESSSKDGKSKQYFISTFAIHHILMRNITFWVEEFTIVECKPQKPDPMTQSMMVSVMETSDQFFSTMSELPIPSISSDSEGDEDTSSIKIFSSGEFQIGCLTGEQEVRISMKQMENIPGPNTELKLNFGVLEVLISPRHYHLITVLLSSFSATPEAPKEEEDDSRNTAKSSQNRNFKEEVSDRLSSFNQMSGGFTFNQAWPNAFNECNAKPGRSHEESSGKGNFGFDSVLSSSSSMTSSMSSMATTTTLNSTQTKTNSKRRTGRDDGSVMSRYDFRMEGVLGVMLHEDILVGSQLAPFCRTNPVTDESAVLLKELTENFFKEINKTNINVAIRNFITLENTLNCLISPYHLQVVMASIIGEGEEKRSAKESLQQFNVSIVKCHLKEVINDISVPLLDFNRNGDELRFPDRPEILLTYQQMEKIRTISGVEYFSPSNRSLSIQLAPSVVEVDISIYDRLKFLSETYPFEEDTIPAKSSKKSSGHFNFKITSTSLDVILRFPVTDLRPLHDPNRVPWWERNVRSDYLMLKLVDCCFKNVNSSEYSLVSAEIVANYCDNEVINLGICQSKFDQITQVTSSPTVLLSFGRSNKRKDETDRKIPPTPFSSKRVCRESDTPHNKSSTEDTEILVIPGDSNEMNDFCDFSFKNSAMKIKIDIPTANLQLRSKHIYEVLYNRINSDLLLWQPASHQTVVSASSDFFNIGLMESSMYIPSAVNFGNLESNSSSSSSDKEEDDYFYSLHNNKLKSNRLAFANEKTTNECDFAFSIGVNEVIITIMPPVRNSQNQVIPERYGELVLKATDLKLFSVRGFCGNDNLGYLCLDANQLQAFHCGLIPTVEFPLNKFGNPLPDYLIKTIYPTEDDLLLSPIKENKSRKMLSMALQIKLSPEQQMKRIRLAVGVQAATLSHNPSPPELTWLTEILDMFDVVDYPIPGYTASGVITEMHLHLWDCAIDYRPLYLPYRAVGTIGNFMISTNITSPSMGCTLRFVAEDSTLSLAPQELPNMSVEDDLPQNIVIYNDNRDLVCVVELGLFEISLRLNDAPSNLSPKFDLRAAVNDVHIRTCADSARALAQFIGYLASEGDLHGSDDDSKDEFSNDEGMDLLSVKQEEKPPVIPELSKSQQIRVTNLMEEAMQESRVSRFGIQAEDDDEDTDDEEPSGAFGTEVFFFPDEAQRLQNKDRDSESMSSELRDQIEFENSVMDPNYLKEMFNEEVEEALPQVKQDLGNIRRNSEGRKSDKKTRKISSETDDDYCIIGEEEKVAFKSPFLDEPAPVSEEPIRIVDNHFSIPTNKPDLLQAPPGFPMATIRYTLCEMTITWHVYGGSDFTQKHEEEETARCEPSVYFPMSDDYRQGVSYFNGGPSSAPKKSPSGSMCWQSKGGTNRMHNVLMEFQLTRVRFSHETYPTNVKQASRQVLLIHEFEIKDRLAVSNINKFLHNNAFGAIKSQRNMVVVNALHIRPDVRLPAQECCLRVALSPLRLHIDQDSLLFLISFFQEFSGTGVANENMETSTISERSSLVEPHPPIMVVDVPEAEQELQAKKMVSENLMLLMDQEAAEQKEEPPVVYGTDENAPIYFRSVQFSPDVRIRIDYHGKRFEMSKGPLPGLLMGLGQLQESELKLKALSSRRGFLGFDELIKYLFKEWLQDIKRNQLPSILGGVGPMHAFVQLFQGFFDLFWMPIEQYKRDGQIIRGLQRGAKSFTARTALAALEITTRLIYLLQITAETAYDMVSPGPSVRRGRNRKGRKKKRLQQPQDIREGMVNAYHIVKEGIDETVHTILEVTASELDQKGLTGAVGAVVREIPSTVVKPLVMVTQATSNVLGGVKNQLVPDARIEAKEKWKDEQE